MSIGGKGVHKMRSLAPAAAMLLISATVQAATVQRYDTRTAFINDTSGRTDIDFETLRPNQCVALPDPAGFTISGVNFNGGIARLTSSGSCSPPLSNFRGYVVYVRLVQGANAATSAFTATLPANVYAVGFDLGVTDAGGVSAENVEVTVITAEGQQVFTVAVTGTGTGSAIRVNPQFAGFISSHSITSVRFRIPNQGTNDRFLIVDDFTFGQVAAPVIRSTNGILNGASFAPTITANSWMTIFGNLLSVSNRPWEGSDFVSNRLPTQIENVSVTIGGRPAYVYFVNPNQLNVLTPSDLPEGPATVVVTRGGMTSAPVTVQVQRVAPGLFMFDPENRRYAVATHANNTLVGKTSLYPGATTPARPGEIITLWGTGFGRTDPAASAGEIVSVARPLIAQPVVVIGGATAEVLFAGLTGSGLYQFNVRIPATLSDGDHLVSVRVEGQSTQDNAYITIAR